MAFGICLLWLLLSAVCSMHLIPVVSEQPGYVWSDRRCLTLEDRPALDQSSSHSSFAADFLKSYVGTESVCEDEHIPAAEVAVVFAGNELRFTDVSSPSLVEDLNFEHLLKNTGVAAAYPVELGDAGLFTSGDSVADYLISTIAASPLQGLGDVVTAGDCEAKSKGKTIGLEYLKEYLVTRKKIRGAGVTDVVIVCLSSPNEKVAGHGLLLNEAKVLSETLSDLQTSGTSYVALHTLGWKEQNDERRSRSLSEAGYGTNATSNTSGNGTLGVCDELCRRRATLWESLFVFLLLLVILISGTCCMAGVNTPTRFESLKEA